MTRKLLLAGLLAVAPIAAHASPAALGEGLGGGGVPPATVSSGGVTIPSLLTGDQRTGYRAVFLAIREHRWQDAQLQLDSLAPGPLHAIARAELYTAHGSPRVELDPLVHLLNEAPELPEAQQIAALATNRGATDLPPLPSVQTLTWIDGAPARVRARSNSRSDQVAAQLATAMQPFIRDDRGAEAQALLESTTGLSPDALTEWQQKISWIYFLQGDNANARAMAQRASGGSGDWAIQGSWVGALAAFRQNDCAAATTGFETVAARAADIELRAAGLYWASRADMRCGRFERVETRLKSAAQYRETFYGLLARQALGIADPAHRAAGSVIAADWETLGRRPNIRVAAALVEVGETGLADSVIRQQARIGSPSEFPALVRLTGAFNLPSTLVWLSHNGPVGAAPPVEARFPAPNWTPDGGWRVDRALVFAHTLQESRFRTDVVSPAGAFGLMQVMPAAATDIGRLHGRSYGRADLSRPGANMEVGQSYLEQLRDQPCTGGLLPKVIAAYNAGSVPVAQWNTVVRDGGDPLLYIESIPYWETRGYVITVMRNYWMYEGQTGRAASPSRSAMAQGLWPRFPGMTGPSAVRIAGDAGGGSGIAPVASAR